MERRWSFQQPNDPELVLGEMSERLMNSIVFILQPPSRNECVVQAANEAQISPGTYVASYADGDGFSADRARARLLVGVSGQNAPSCNRIVEIKTSHQFPKSEILAILAPKELCDLAKKYFPDSPIRPVNRARKALHRIPGILKIMHGAMIAGIADVIAPDYYTAINEWQRETGRTRFSIHSVRLATSFDFDTRPVASLTASEAILTATKAKIMVRYENDSAWVLVHRAYSTNLTQYFERAKIALPDVAYQGMRTALSEHLQWYDELSKAKGDWRFNKINTALSQRQQAWLASVGVRLTPHQRVPNTYYAYLPDHKQQVAQQIIDNVDRFESQVAKLSQVMQGFWTRKCMFKASQAQKKVLEARRALSQAEETFEVAKSRLETTRL